MLKLRRRRLPAAFLPFVLTLVLASAANAEQKSSSLQPPSHIKVLKATRSAVTLSWSAPNGATRARSYALLVDGRRQKRVVQTAATVRGLHCSTAYSLSVVAFANVKSASTSTTVSTASCRDSKAPAMPGDLREVSAAATSAFIAWSRSSDNVGVAGYEVYSGGLKMATVTDTTYLVQGLACGAARTIGVLAIDAAGNRSRRAAMVATTTPCTTPTAPPTPTGLSVTGSSQSTISLGWDGSQAASYGLYVSGTRVAAVATASGTVAGLACGRSYSVGVDAVDETGLRSSISTISSATAPCPAATPVDSTPPTPPGGLTVSSLARTSVGLRWNASTDAKGVAGYDVYVDGTKTSTVSSPASSATGLTCSTSYRFEVDAYDAAGNHSGRSGLDARTSECFLSAPPAVPWPIQLVAQGASTIAIAWPAVTGAATYDVYVNGLKKGSTSQPSWNFSGLACGTLYTIGVDAADAELNVSLPGIAMFGTTACPDTTAPSTPTGLRTANVDTTSATLSWSAAADNVGVIGYRLYSGVNQVGTSAGLSYGFTGLSCGATTSLGVSAYDAAGNASPIQKLDVTTAPCPPAPPSTSALAWAPPTLTNPTTITVSNPTRDIVMDPTKDYIIKFPATAVKPGSDGCLWTQGGHNIVVIGGECDFTGVVNTSSSEDEGRVATFNGATGTVHMEGVWAHGDGLIEGVQWYSPGAILQLENDRFDHLHVEAAQYHSDVVAFDNSGTLRIDRFTASSELQGISQFFSTSKLDLRNVNLAGLSGAQDSSPVLSWFTASVSLTNYWVQTRPGEPFSSTLRPSGGSVASDGSVSWPGTSVTGSARQGSPPSGDFVPIGVAGTGYTSPGYH